MGLSLNGIKLRSESDYLAELRDASAFVDDLAALRKRMEEDGYLLLRGFLSRETVLRAREEILSKYALAGEIDAVGHPLMEAVCSESSVLDRIDLAAFAESVRRGPAYRSVVLHPRLIAFFERWFDGRRVRPFDFKWPRFFRPGEGTGLHCDAPYLNGGTRNLYSVWIPLGDVVREGGTLIVLEHSHTSQLVREVYASRDSELDQLDWLDSDPVRFQERIGGRWLTADFQAGDVLIFSVDLVHGGTDNRSPERRCRLTSDTRYQPADEPLDARWNGPRIDRQGVDFEASQVVGVPSTDVAEARRALSRLVLRPPD